MDRLYVEHGFNHSNEMFNWKSVEEDEVTKRGWTPCLLCLSAGSQEDAHPVHASNRQIEKYKVEENRSGLASKNIHNRHRQAGIFLWDLRGRGEDGKQ